MTATGPKMNPMAGRLQDFQGDIGHDAGHKTRLSMAPIWSMVPGTAGGKFAPLAARIRANVPPISCTRTRQL